MNIPNSPPGFNHQLVPQLLHLCVGIHGSFYFEPRKVADNRIRHHAPPKNNNISCHRRGDNAMSEKINGAFMFK